MRSTQGWLIISISIPLNVKLSFEYVARTPADKPIVCAAVAQWNSGRTRLALGGYGKIPMLAMDGTVRNIVWMSLLRWQRGVWKAFHELAVVCQHPSFGTR
jgi:hypothetical protein